MTGKIFVHIGLPKTATTTLQVELFPAIARNEITYLGVYQPRSSKTQDAFFTKIYDAIKSGYEISKVKDELTSRLQSGESLIVSEEMITVSQHEEELRSKLQNLSSLLGGLDYQIIVTVREPGSALFSYYVERYDEFYRRNVGFMDAAMSDESMFIFHYRKLIDTLLANFDRYRLHVFRFEDIVKGQLQQLCDLLSPGKHQENEFKFAIHNKKTKGEGFILANKHSTAGAFLKRHLVILKDCCPSFYKLAKYGFKPFGLVLEYIRFGEMKVKQPSDGDMNHLKEYLREETAALESLFGIKY